VLSAAQYLVFDDLATRHGNQTLRITTRQSLQFHGVVKSGLGPLMKGINDALVDTLAACGDVNRNVMASPTPAFTQARREAYEHARLVSDSLLPKTRAYHAIWVEGVQLDLEAPENKDFVDPLYGKQYLPRKFKVAFVVPPSNDMDVLTNDLGFIAVVENDHVVGYNLAVGGGMGRSHGNDATYPRIADVLGFLTPDKLVDVAKAVLTVHRDFGDRTDRKHARLKYVIAERGAAWAKAEIEKRAGIVLGPVRPFEFKDTSDVLDWHPQGDGNWFLGLYVRMGRIKDDGALRLKSALVAVAKQFPTVEFRFTANQNVLLANVAPAQKDAVDAVLAAHGVRTSRQTTVLQAAAIGCPSLPTCGLGLAESERFLPALVDRIDALATGVGLGGQEIIIRMTGCPNGCARPYVAEIGFVGKAPGRYQIWLGGNAPGTRIGRIWKDLVKEADIETELRPLLVRYAAERTPGERFGDWVARAFWTEQPVPAAAN
jgi:sulfite reductase (NADPH) hemoprotein beta-component